MAQTSVEFGDSKPGGIYLKPGLPEKKVQPEKNKSYTNVEIPERGRQFP